MIYEELAVCENIVIDSRTNKLSYINIIDEINPMGLPIIIPRFSIIAIFKKEQDDTEEEYRYELKMKLGELEIFNQPVIAKFLGKKRTRLILEIVNLPLNATGTLRVELFQGEVLILHYYIEVAVPTRPTVIETQQ